MIIIVNVRKKLSTVPCAHLIVSLEKQAHQSSFRDDVDVNKSL